VAKQKTWKSPFHVTAVELLPILLTDIQNSEHILKLDGCIVLNEHNTVFASKRSVICNRCFPWPTRVLGANASRSLQPFLQGSLDDRDTPTDYATRSVTIDGIYVHSIAM